MSAQAITERRGLLGIGLWEKQRELISADAKCEIRSAQIFPQSGCGELQYLIALQVAVAVVDFFQPVQIEQHKGELLAVAFGAIEFLVAIFLEQPAIIKTGKRVGGRVELKFFEFLILHQNRHAQETGGGENVDHGGFQRYTLAHALGELGAAREDLAPIVEALCRRDVDARDGFEELLEKSSTDGLLDIVESLDKKVEERVVGRRRGIRLRWLGHQSISRALSGLTYLVLFE